MKSHLCSERQRLICNLYISLKICKITWEQTEWWKTDSMESSEPPFKDLSLLNKKLLPDTIVIWVCSFALLYGKGRWFGTVPTISIFLKTGTFQEYVAQEYSICNASQIMITTFLYHEWPKFTYWLKYIKWNLKLWASWPISRSRYKLSLGWFFALTCQQKFKLQAPGMPLLFDAANVQHSVSGLLFSFFLSFFARKPLSCCGRVLNFLCSCIGKLLLSDYGSYKRGTIQCYMPNSLPQILKSKMKQTSLDSYFLKHHVNETPEPRRKLR